MPTLKAIHICNSLQPLHKPKIAKEYVLPTLQTERKIKYENTTMCISNSGLSDKTKDKI